MALTFKDLQDEVLNHGFDETYRSRVKNWLNEAQQRFAREVRVPDLLRVVILATNAQTSSIAYPIDFMRLMSVTETSGPRELDGVNLKTIDVAPSKFGRPSVFSLDEATKGLKLYPTPDQAYNLQLRYWASPTDMTQPTDLPSTPAAYQDMLITYALMRAYRAEDDFEATNFYTNQFAGDLRAAATDLQYRDISPRQISGIWDY